MKDSEGIISKIACFNFKKCDTTDFIEACFNFKDLKLINVTNVKIDLIDETEVRELLIVPLTSIDVKAVLILAKPCKFSGFELKFLRRIRDLMSLGLTNARNYKRLQEESYLDPLTKLYNRRFGMKRFQELLSLAARESKPLVVGMMDIDDFKKINDTYGHLAGDYVLRTLATIIKQHVRDIDLVVRYGGEEILIVLFNTDKSNGKKVFERIRETIEKYSFEFEGNPIKVTVSIGYYPIPPEELIENAKNRYKEFIEKADEALYKAKKTGKNRVVCYSRREIKENSQTY
ncbi:GGDEF domain-containing protein [Desulfurobacterium sp.]